MAKRKPTQGANVIPFRQRTTIAPSLLTPPPDRKNQEYVDLNERYILNSETTIFLTAIGSGFSPQIEDGDALITDFSVEPVKGDLVVLHIGDEEMTIKKFDGFDDFAGARHVGVVLHVFRTIREVEMKKRKGGAR